MNLSTYLIVKGMDVSRSFYKALFQSESDGWYFNLTDPVGNCIEIAGGYNP
jgi:hypothetical protein